MQTCDTCSYLQFNMQISSKTCCKAWLQSLFYSHHTTVLKFCFRFDPHASHRSSGIQQTNALCAYDQSLTLELTKLLNVFVGQIAFELLRKYFHSTIEPSLWGSEVLAHTVYTLSKAIIWLIVFLMNEISRVSGLYIATQHQHPG